MKYILLGFLTIFGVLTSVAQSINEQGIITPDPNFHCHWNVAEGLVCHSHAGETPIGLNICSVILIPPNCFCDPNTGQVTCEDDFFMFEEVPDWTKEIDRHSLINQNVIVDRLNNLESLVNRDQ